MQRAARGERGIEGKVAAGGAVRLSVRPSVRGGRDSRVAGELLDGWGWD